MTAVWITAIVCGTLVLLVFILGWMSVWQKKNTEGGDSSE